MTEEEIERLTQAFADKCELTICWPDRPPARNVLENIVRQVIADTSLVIEGVVHMEDWIES